MVRPMGLPTVETVCTSTWSCRGGIYLSWVKYICVDERAQSLLKVTYRMKSGASRLRIRHWWRKISLLAHEGNFHHLAPTPIGATLLSDKTSKLPLAIQSVCVRRRRKGLSTVHCIPVFGGWDLAQSHWQNATPGFWRNREFTRRHSATSAGRFFSSHPVNQFPDMAIFHLSTRLIT